MFTTKLYRILKENLYEQDKSKTVELDQHLSYLSLLFIRDNYESLAKQAAQKQWTHIQYLTEVIQAQANSVVIAPSNAEYTRRASPNHNHGAV